MTMTSRTRWLALYVLCLGDLMIVLDTTIVNVALPSIRDDLGFSQTSLAWVVNAYLLTFGGFLLLAGRLGDLFGHRRLFLIGISLFTLSSLACGLSTSQGLLITARAVQGIGGAVVSAVAFSLIMVLFTEAGDRAKAMGVFGFVMAGGGTLGVLLGGILTDALDWHWIFLVNIPIGILVYFLSLRLLPKEHVRGEGRLDVAGAILVTSVAASETPAGHVDVVASDGAAQYLVRTPKLAAAGNGAGDLIAALFLYHYLGSGSVAEALARATSSVFGLLRRTLAAGASELVLISAQDELIAPSELFQPQRIAP